jgi:membrane associated rhomboid family serine protease
MRQDVGFGFQFRRPTRVVGATLVVLVAMFVVFALIARFSPGGLNLYLAFALEPQAVLHGQHLWGVLTYALLHSLTDIDHLLLNGLVFYFFAPDLEELWGARRFVIFMLVTALGGAAFVVAASALGLSTADTVVGFSSVVMGVNIAWGLIYPEREMFLLIFRMKGKHLIYVTVALQVLTALSFSRVSAAGHFGGMAAAAVFTMTQSGRLRRWWLERRLQRLQAEAATLRAARRASGPSLRVIKGGGDDEPPKDKRYLN